MGGQFVAEEEKLDVIARAKAGQSNAEIGRAHGRKAETVRKRLEAYGVKSAHKRGPVEDMLEKMERLWREGETATAIARILGTTRNAVCGHAFRKKWPRSDEVREIAARNTGNKAKPLPAKPALKIVGNGAVFHEDAEQRAPRAEAKTIGAVPGSIGRRIIDAPGRYLPGCKWPIATPSRDMSETLFCCAPRDGEKPYCSDHAAAAYSTAPKMSGKQFARSVRRYA